jgi:hypothetical protein
MKTIKIAGYKITIESEDNNQAVKIFEGVDKLPICGTILYGNTTQIAEEWAIHKISQYLTK